jgi:N-acetylglucosaminyldiphosphoundecaprenol N-acetyl-beta-D-mannosaminyltransferase
LGYGVDGYDFEQALEYAQDNGGQVVTINPEMILAAQKSTEFSQIINDAELVIPDGIGVQIGLQILGHKVKRIPGIEFGYSLLEKYSIAGKRVALVGAKPEVIALAVKNLKDKMPNLNIVYSHDGYFSDDNEIIKGLVESSADLILIALGSPKQEFFISKLKSHMPKSLMVGLGGSFDVWAGVVKRAPKIYQKLGLEWLYRTVKEPQRFKRIFPTLPLFLLKVLKERVSRG